MVSTEIFIEKYAPILEYINGYGIIDNYKNDYALISYSPFDHDSKLDENAVYITNVEEPITEPPKMEQSLFFIHRGDKSFFQKELSIDYGFHAVEKINDSKNHRIYFFTSCYDVIYEMLINNLELTQNLVQLFKNQNKHITEIFDAIKIDFHNHKTKYFREPNHFSCYSEKEQFLAMLKAMNVLNENVSLTQDEWKIMNIYNYGTTNSVDMSHFFGNAGEATAVTINQIKHKLFSN